MDSKADVEVVSNNGDVEIKSGGKTKAKISKTALIALLTALISAVGNYYKTAISGEEHYQVNQAAFELLQTQVELLREQLKNMRLEMKRETPRIAEDKSKLEVRSFSMRSPAMAGEAIATKPDPVKSIKMNAVFDRVAKKVNYKNLIQQVQQDGEIDLGKILEPKPMEALPIEEAMIDGGTSD